MSQSITGSNWKERKKISHEKVSLFLPRSVTRQTTNIARASEVNIAQRQGPGCADPNNTRLCRLLSFVHAHWILSSWPPRSPVPDRQRIFCPPTLGSGASERGITP